MHLRKKTFERDFNSTPHEEGGSRGSEGGSVGGEDGLWEGPSGDRRSDREICCRK